MRLMICPLAIALLMPLILGMDKPIRLEAEQARTVGAKPTTQRSGYSGDAYLSGFHNPGDQAVFTVTLPAAGAYDVQMRYCSPSGGKGYDLDVNGLKLSGFFPQAQDFAMHRAGLVELNQGENSLTLGRGWGYYDIDYMELTPVTDIAPPAKPPKTLVDPAATPKTRQIMAWLIDHYGQSTLSGVYSDQDAEYVRQLTGKTPAIMGGDFMDYSPSRIAHGAKPDGTTERLINHARSGSIVTLSWHWNAPKDLIDKVLTTPNGQQFDARWWKGFNSNATTFDLEKALANPQSEDYQLLLRDIDAIAIELRKLAEADVPVLWRPLHEADGRWFWWGAKGPQPFIQLWQLMFGRLTNHHQLHNLIWVYTGTANMEWYPGDQYVDIIGIDSYPQDLRDPHSGLWQDLQAHFAGKKLLAISEYGGVPDIPRMHRLGGYWSYFVTWPSFLDPKKMPPDDLRRIYTDPAVLNCDATAASSCSGPSSP